MTFLVDTYPALPWPDGLRRIRPAHVIRTNSPDTRRTEPEPYRTLAHEVDAWERNRAS